MEIKEEILDWLLDPSDPSVRYHTLLKLKKVDEDTPEAQKPRKAIMDSPLVKEILSKQTPDGYWGTEEDLYLPKYTATTHPLLILAELGATRTPEIE